MLAPDTIEAYTAKSAYLYFSHRADESLRTANAGLAINPNYAALYGVRSTANSSLGQFEQAKSDAQQAMRLSPRDPLIGLFHVRLGNAELGLGHFDAAIEEYQNAIDSWLSPLLRIQTNCLARRLRARGQDGRGEDRRGGSQPPSTPKPSL